MHWIQKEERVRVDSKLSLFIILINLHLMLDDGPGWDVDELELPEELVSKMKATNISGDGYYVVPNRGVSPAQQWANFSPLVADHIKAGSFETAFKLLNEQIGVVNFKPYKALFMTLYTGSRTSFTALPNLPPLHGYPQRNHKETNPKNARPAVGIKLNDLVQRLQVKFSTYFVRINT